MQLVALSGASTAGVFDYVRIAGPDAIDFLQGQVTCDMQQLTPENSLMGAMCNIKGRVIADFHLTQWDDSAILLQTARDLGQKIIDTLARYAVFSRVELQAIPGPVAVYGLIGEATTQALQPLFPTLPMSVLGMTQSDDSSLIRMPGPVPRWQIHCRSAAAVARLAQLEALASTATIEGWVRQDILAGMAHTAPHTCEQYTPQLLNFDLSGVVDFAKGCYTGQEVVARMYYRSKAKKRLYRLRSGQQLADAGSADAEILSAVGPLETGQDSFALAIVGTQLAASGGPLSLPGLDGNLVQSHVEEISYDR